MKIKCAKPCCENTRECAWWDYLLLMLITLDPHPFFCSDCCAPENDLTKEEWAEVERLMTGGTK